MSDADLGETFNTTFIKNLKDVLSKKLRSSLVWKSVNGYVTVHSLCMDADKM